jgi:hypothetical protein
MGKLLYSIAFSFAFLANAPANEIVFVPNPFGIGPSRLPPGVIDFCRSHKEQSAEKCLERLGWYKKGAPEHTWSPIQACLNRFAGGAVTIPVAAYHLSKQPVKVLGDLYIFYGNRFHISLSETQVQVEEVTELWFNNLKALLLTDMVNLAPNIDICKLRQRGLNESVIVSNGVVYARIDVRSVANACATVPIIGATKTFVDEHTVGIGVDLVASLEDGVFIIHPKPFYDPRGEPGGNFKTLEQIWNQATFGIPFFRSNNYGAALEAINNGASTVASIGLEDFRKSFAVPALKAFDFKMIQSGFFPAPNWPGYEAWKDSIRVDITSNATLPREFACTVLSAADKVSGVVRGR